MKKTIIAAALAVLFASQACKQEEQPVTPPGEFAIGLSVDEFPAFTEKSTIGTPDAGKTEWKDGDALYVVLQTAESQTAAQYRVSMQSGEWSKVEMFNSGKYTPETSMTLPGNSRALVFYAPAYEFKTGEVLSLRSGYTAGLEEFLEWSSGEDYDITSATTLEVNFVKDYSRLRIVTDRENSVDLTARTFIPAGYNTSKLDKTTLTADADSKGNAYFYGCWPKGATLNLEAYDRRGEPVYEKTYEDMEASENGTGYALYCKEEEEENIGLAIGTFPAFSESSSIGAPESGKTKWADGDELYVVLQTAESRTAAQYRVSMSSKTWSVIEKFENGKYTAVTAIPSPGNCRALVFYAPAYEFKTGEVISLRSGYAAGTDEFLSWSSGEDYDITGAAMLDVEFVKDYSRLRIVAEKNSTVEMKCSDFVPAGYETSKLGSAALTTIANSKENAFYYGSWAKGTSFDVNTYNQGGTFIYGDIFSVSDPNEDGVSYAFNCKDEKIEYTTLAELAAQATTTESSFSCKVKDAVVTYSSGKYAHLEDQSGAIMVFCTGHGLSEGECITGDISGKIKVFNNATEITSLDITKATVTSAAEVPCTEMTLAELLSDFAANESRKIKIKNITIDKGISSSSRSGQISQNGSAIAIYASNTSSPAVLEAGLEGDLIAFPTYYKTTKQLAVYEASQFTEGGGGEPEDTPFTRLSLAGFYSATNTDSPTAVMTYSEGNDQYSFGNDADGYSFYHLFNLEQGTYGTLLLDATTYKIGNEFSVIANLNGKEESHDIKVVNKDSSRAWLEDKTNNVGYIISIK